MRAIFVFSTLIAISYATLADDDALIVLCNLGNALVNAQNATRYIAVKPM
jgi:hypothetical protein